MFFRFDALAETHMPEFKGGKGELIAHMFANDEIRIFRGKLSAGSSIGLHTHDTSNEVLIFINGQGSVLLEGTKTPVSGGMCHYCPKGASHSLINDSNADLEFYAIVPQL